MLSIIAQALVHTMEAKREIEYGAEKSDVQKKVDVFVVCGKFDFTQACFDRAGGIHADEHFEDGLVFEIFPVL